MLVRGDGLGRLFCLTGPASQFLSLFLTVATSDVAMTYSPRVCLDCPLRALLLVGLPLPLVGLPLPRGFLLPSIQRRGTSNRTPAHATFTRSRLPAFGTADCSAARRR
jgi:hypothetical protein